MINEELLWTCLTVIIRQNAKLMQAAGIYGPSENPLLDEIEREIEAIKRSRHG